MNAEGIYNSSDGCYLFVHCVGRNATSLMDRWEGIASVVDGTCSVHGCQTKRNWTNTTHRTHAYACICTPLGLCRWGDWKRETWHRETIKIVGTDFVRLDNAVPYRKGGHRETCFSVRVDAHYKLMFDSGSIIWAAHRFYVCSSISFCFTYCYVRQTKWASSELSGQRLGAL